MKKPHARNLDEKLARRPKKSFATFFRDYYPFCVANNIQATRSGRDSITLVSRVSYNVVTIRITRWYRDTNNVNRWYPKSRAPPHFLKRNVAFTGRVEWHLRVCPTMIRSARLDIARYDRAIGDSKGASREINPTVISVSQSSITRHFLVRERNALFSHLSSNVSRNRDGGIACCEESRTARSLIWTGLYIDISNITIPLVWPFALSRLSKRDTRLLSRTVQQQRETSRSLLSVVFETRRAFEARGWCRSSWKTEKLGIWLREVRSTADSRTESTRFWRSRLIAWSRTVWQIDGRCRYTKYWFGSRGGYD